MAEGLGQVKYTVNFPKIGLTKKPTSFKTPAPENRVMVAGGEGWSWVEWRVGVTVVMELFCTSIVSSSISGLGDVTMVLQEVVTGGNWVKLAEDLSVLFLTTAWILKKFSIKKLKKPSPSLQISKLRTQLNEPKLNFMHMAEKSVLI